MITSTLVAQLKSIGLSRRGHWLKPRVKRDF
jgi:hypothetical protein